MIQEKMNMWRGIGLIFQKDSFENRISFLIMLQHKSKVC